MPPTRTQMEPGKLFIGGISWDTDEESLREYFQTFGEVVEAVIMKDRTTGRARGFGFVVFSDPAVAERVVKRKHMIDGRTVEAKKAVPRDDQQSLSRGNCSIQGSPAPTHTKKIFIGGLASTVTEKDFKHYFDQFGTITDVVVMYDHNTQRPRGFGFITYDSEESLDKVLLKPFHELHGKMVEVKRAVPKELSVVSSRSQLSGCNYGLSRANGLLEAYNKGYNRWSVGGYGVRRDGRFSPVGVGRAGHPPFSSSTYSVGPNSDSALGTSHRGNRNLSLNLGYGHALNPMFSVIANRYASPIGYGMTSGSNGDRSVSLMSSPNRDMWGNASHNYTTYSPTLGPGSGLSSNEAIWGNANSNQGNTSVRGNSGLIGSNLKYGNEENSMGYGRNGGNSIAAAPLYGETDEGDIGGLDSYGGGGGGGSFYIDATWRSSSPGLEIPGLLGYHLGRGSSNNRVDTAGYSVANRGTLHAF